MPSTVAEGGAERVTRALSEVLQAVVRRAKKASRVVVVLDYDGTLVPFAPIPDLAIADPELLELLARLGAQPRFEVHVVSGRSRETLERWLGALPVNLHAEDGAWSRLEGQREWRPLALPPLAWRVPVLALLANLAARTPGAFVEEKTFGLAWHYRLADPGDGASRADDLQRQLRTRLADELVAFVCPAEPIARAHAVPAEPA